MSKKCLGLQKSSSLKYKHIFFDLDHTLWDFEKNSKDALEDVFNRFALNDKLSCPFEDFYLNYREINLKYWARFRKGYISREDLKWKRMQAVLMHYKKYDDELARNMAGSYLEWLPEKKRLFPYAWDVLNHLYTRGVGMSILSNGFEEVQNHKLENVGIRHFFSKVITSETALCVKPDLEIFEYALDKTGTRKEDALMVGDNLEVDIVGARTAGLDQLYFNPENIQHEEKITYEVSCLSEIITLFANE